MTRKHRLRADTHVHYHDCFEEGPFLDAASANLGAESDEEGLVNAVLCLTESAGADWFGQLSTLKAGSKIGSSEWAVQPTSEQNSVLATCTGDRKLAIIAGRQIVCQEGLEVLALGCAEMIEDRQPIRTVLQMVEGAGALPVIPWGFGKWLGARGELVRELLTDSPCDFVLGDNGGRLAGIREPALFANARSRGIAILPGTDPFPFSWDGSRVGSFGVEWDRSIQPLTPYRDFRQLVTSHVSSAEQFGRLERLPAFVRNQIAIQLKRIPSRWQK